MRACCPVLSCQLGLHTLRAYHYQQEKALLASSQDSRCFEAGNLPRYIRRAGGAWRKKITEISPQLSVCHHRPPDMVCWIGRCLTIQHRCWHQAIHSVKSTPLNKNTKELLLQEKINYSQDGPKCFDFLPSYPCEGLTRQHGGTKEQERCNSSIRFNKSRYHGMTISDGPFIWLGAAWSRML